MIYTGTYRDGEKLGNGTFYKLRISVTQPKWANTDGAVPALFPDADILWGYKQGSVTMEQYTQRYLAALDSRRDQVKAQVENARRLAGGRPLILLCLLVRQGEVLPQAPLRPLVAGEHGGGRTGDID